MLVRWGHEHVHQRVSALQTVGQALGSPAREQDHHLQAMTRRQREQIHRWRELAHHPRALFVVSTGRTKPWTQALCEARWWLALPVVVASAPDVVAMAPTSTRMRPG